MSARYFSSKYEGGRDSLSDIWNLEKIFIVSQERRQCFFRKLKPLGIIRDHVRYLGSMRRNGSSFDVLYARNIDAKAARRRFRHRFRRIQVPTPNRISKQFERGAQATR